MVVFVFVGIEFVGFMVGEIENFEKVIFKVINNIFVCVLFFYIGVFFVIMSIYFWDIINFSESLFV